MYENIIAYAAHKDGFEGLTRAEPFTSDAEMNIYCAAYTAGVNERLALTATIDLRENDPSVM